jgi:type IV pilus assembly protein PilA
MKQIKNRKGLTLIELLIVVIILGALAAIAIPRMSQSSDTAKTKACLTNIATMNTQIELYHSDHDDDPWPDLEDVTGDPNCFPDGPPSCPSSGTYSFYGTNHRVTCSTHGH